MSWKFEIKAGSYTDAHILYNALERERIERKFVDQQLPDSVNRLYEDLKEKLEIEEF